MRTQDEIAGYAAGVEDFFGFKKEALVYCLDFEHAKPFLKDEVTEAEWEPTLTDEDVLKDMRDYMIFAIGKCEDHRGLSAGRSVNKLNAWTWVLGFEPIEEPYAQYGAPILKALCERHGFEWPTDNDPLNRMAQGMKCEPGCLEGCGT